MLNHNNEILLEEVLQKWHSDLLPLYSLLKKLDNSKKIKNDELQALLGLLEKSGSSCQNIIDSFYDLKEKVKVFRNEIDNLSVIEDEKKLIIESYKLNFSNLTLELSDVSSKIDQKKKEFSTLQNQYDQKYNSYLQIISDLDVKTAQNWVPETFPPNEEAFSSSPQPITEEIKTADGLNKDIDFLNKVLDQEIEVKQKKSEYLSGRIEEKAYALERMEKHLNLFTSQMKEIESKFSQFDSSTEKCSEYFAVFEKKFELQSKILLDPVDIYNSYKQAHKVSLNKIIMDVSGSFNELKKNENLISIRKKELDIINQNIKKDFPDFDFQIKNLNFKIESMDAEIMHQRSIIKDYQSRILELENNNKLLEQSKVEYNNSSKIIKDQLDNSYKEHRKDIEVIQSINNEKSKVEEEFKLLRSQNDELLDEYNKLLLFFKTNENQVENLKTENSNLVKLNKEYELKTTEYLIRMTEYDENNRTQEEIINNQRTKIDKLIREQMELTETNVAAIKEIEKYRIDNENLKLLKDEKGFDENKLMNEIQILTKRKSESERIILELEKLNTSLAGQIRKRENIIQDLEIENQSLSNKLREYSDQKINE